jgi:hypothetical protein
MLGRTRLSARHSRLRGDRDGAIAEIREALRLNPEEQTYRTQLSALLKSQK